MNNTCLPTRRNASRLNKEIAELVAELRAAQAHENALRACPSRPVVKIMRREPNSGRREAAAVAMLSDLHVKGTNLEIAEEALGRFFDGCRWLNNLYRARFGVRDMVVAILGGLLEGASVETALCLRDRLITGIRSLLDDPGLEHLYVPCVTQSVNSDEWLLYQMLAHEFRDEERATFVVDRTPHKWLRIYDFTVHICRGDDVRHFGDVEGLTIPLGKRIRAWDKPRRAHYHVLGHFRALKDFQNATVNGSLTHREPTQGYFLIDSSRGKTAVHPILVR